MASGQDRPETHNGYLDTFEDPVWDSYEQMLAALRPPPPPQPTEIKHVVLDADDTMWQIDPWGLATVAEPVGKTKGNVLPARLDLSALEDAPEYWQERELTGVVALQPTLRKTLASLKERGIGVSIASHNYEESILKYLDAFGLRDQFADIEASMGRDKDKMVERIAQRQDVDISEVLFVDDSYGNCLDVAQRTGATALHFGYNIDTLEELLEFIK